MNHRHLFAALAIPFLLAACGPATPAVDCGSGESFEADGEAYCVYNSPITEEGFECPSDLSTARRLGDLVICSKGSGDVPSELFDELPGRFSDVDLPFGPCTNVLCETNEECSAGSCSEVDDSTCLEDCGGTCNEQICGSDGEIYCNACTVTCSGAQIADDPTICNPEPGEAECLENCGDGCPAPEFQICASNGARYCNSCVIECKGLVEASNDSLCDD